MYIIYPHAQYKLLQLQACQCLAYIIAAGHVDVVILVYLEKANKSQKGIELLELTHI